MQLLKPITVILFISVVILFAPSRAHSQSRNAIVPNYWDSNVRVARPEKPKITRLRFLTTTDFPPFNFIDRNKRLTGFHIDMARHICSELDILLLCQIQALPWEELDSAIEKGEGEAIIAGLEKTPVSEKLYDFSRSFLQVPARFTALRTSKLREPLARSLFQKKTGLVEGSAHARYFKTVFSNRKYIEYASLAEAQKALNEKLVDAIFSDAVSLGFWITSKSAANCCQFVGGPYVSSKYFGNGLSIAVAKGHPDLVEAIDYALRRINDNGKFKELYLRYFPVSLY